LGFQYITSESDKVFLSDVQSSTLNQSLQPMAGGCTLFGYPWFGFDPKIHHDLWLLLLYLLKTCCRQTFYTLLIGSSWNRMEKTLNMKMVSKFNNSKNFKTNFKKILNGFEF
jgi:hypothetical protein